MGRSNGASFEIVTGNLVEEFNGVPFEFFNGVNELVNKYGNIYNDENWWSLYVPVWSGRINEIYGKTIVSHYAYYKQRELGLDNTDILDKYYNYVKRI
jgi:hypothetical protein